MKKERKKRNKESKVLSSAQEVKYSRAFKMADRAGGFGDYHEKI